MLIIARTISLVRMRNSVNPASGLKTALTIVFSVEHIFTAHAQKRLFMNFRSKIWPRHSLRRPRFPMWQMHFHYRVTFTKYIRCVCATTSHDRVTLTFDLLTFRVFLVQCFSCPTHIPIIIILWLTVTELRVLNIWSHFRYLKQSLRMRRVTWPLIGAKRVHIFEIPDPNCLFTLSLSGRYDEN